MAAAKFLPNINIRGDASKWTGALTTPRWDHFSTEPPFGVARYMEQKQHRLRSGIQARSIPPKKPRSIGRHGQNTSLRKVGAIVSFSIYGMSLPPAITPN